MEKKTFKLEILDHVFDVEFSPTEDNWGIQQVQEGSSAAMGWGSHAKGIILVNTIYDEDTWLSTFCHELAHMFVNRFSYPLKEHVIDMIGMGMHSFLKNNIDIVNELYHPDLKHVAEERDQLVITVNKLIDEIEDLKDGIDVGAEFNWDLINE